MGLISSIIGFLSGFSGWTENQSQSTSMYKPVTHQANQDPANPQLNTIGMELMIDYQPDTVQKSSLQINPTTPQIASPTYCQPSMQQPLNIIDPSQNPEIVQWIPSTSKKCSELEGRAVVGGYSIYGADLWVIRTVFEGEMLPAALNYGTKDAFVAYRGLEYQINVFEVCCIPAKRVRWVECSNGQVTSNTVVGGRTKTGEKLYVGRALYSKCKSPGMVQPSHGVLYLSYGYKAYAIQFYEVLCVV